MHVAKTLFHFFTSITPLVSEQCVGTYLANNIIWEKKMWHTNWAVGACYGSEICSEFVNIWKDLPMGSRCRERIVLRDGRWW